MRSHLLLFLIAFVTPSIAQDFPRKDFQMEKLADEIFPVQDLDLNYEELYENLAQLLSNPIDLNDITLEQLRSLMVLTEEEIREFLQYRQQQGPLFSVYELQSIPAWSRSSFDKVIPFVMVRDANTRFDASVLRRLTHEDNNYLLLRYERNLDIKKGYQPFTDSTQRYAGSPDKFYLRYRVSNANDFSFGFTGEKDAGETLVWDPAKKYYGADYLSMHAQVQNKGKLKNLIAGDFQSQFGQGLILGSVFGFGKNAETVTTVRRSNLGFLPYTSMNETMFFRGGAISYAVSSKVITHGFFSSTFKDGALSTSDSEDQSITSLSTSGLHRTLSELSNRKQVRVEDAGVVLQFKNRRLDAGMILHHIQFDHSFFRNPTPFNQFAFKGTSNLNAGLFINYTLGNTSWFSEYAQSIGYGHALVAGMVGNIASSLEVSVLFRDFSKDFYSFNSNAFSESTSAQNEQGFYAGYKYRLSKQFSASGYLDIFQFPWLRYRGYAPSEGSEWLLRFTYAPLKTIQLFIQAREESKVRNLSTETNLYQPAQGVKRNYWISCDYPLLTQFKLKTRLQCSTYELNGHSSQGMALVQDISYSIQRWSFAFRHALFDTDDFDNRIYQYERDVWLAYSFPAYYGTGIKNYVLVQYIVSKNLTLWFRWAHLRYANKNEIGSGSETIGGNTENDIKFQVRIKF